MSSGRRARLSVSIGTLVVNGAPSGGAQALKAALARELGRALSGGGQAQALAAATPARRARVDAVAAAPRDRSTNAQAAALAQAIHRAITAGDTGGGRRT